MNESSDDVTEAILSATPGARAALCAREGAAEAILSGGPRDALVAALVEAVEDGGGAPRDRCAMGAVLSDLGDPRLRVAADDDYWVPLTTPDGTDYDIGAFPVTNQEYRAFVDAGGYDDPSSWSDEGRAWLAETEDAWPVLAARPDVAMFTADNQPVVGVSAWEAEAFARFHGVRLPTWAERVHAVRGESKRPYPWGSPFGEGHANTREEALERPCAVGLFRADCSPEGVFDLAGNAGEWTAERVGDEMLLHPGSWERPSLAAWAKASTTAAPGARWSALGFRLARDRS